MFPNVTTSTVYELSLSREQLELALIQWFEMTYPACRDRDRITITTGADGGLRIEVVAPRASSPVTVEPRDLWARAGLTPA